MAFFPTIDSTLQRELTNRQSYRTAVAAANGATTRTEPRILVAVDPSWPYYDVWQSPSGKKFHEVTNLDVEAGIDWTTTASYEENAGVGRVEAVRSFQSANGVESGFSFVLQATDEDQSGDIITATQKEVIEPFMFFESLKRPFVTPQDGISHGPPPIIVIMGQFATIRGLCFAFTVVGNPMFDPKTVLPHRMECQFTVISTQRKITPFYPPDRRFT